MDQTLHLETLLVEYNNTLNHFTQAQKNYFELVKSNNKHTSQVNNEDNLTTIPNSQFFGTTGLKTSYVANANECSSLCSNSTLCSGATYTSTSGKCALQSGEGTITHHSSDSAIVPKSVKYLVEMNTYNTQLKKINSEIIHLTKTTLVPDIFKTNAKINIMSNKLQERDVILTNRQDELEALIARLSPELDNVQSGSQLTLQSLKIWYVILLGFAIGLIIVILKMSAVGATLSSSFSTSISLPSRVPTIPSIPFVK
jgi:hypothetical protein